MAGPTLGQLLRAGSNATVGRSLSNGGTEGDALRALRAAFGGYSDDVYQQAYERGLQAWQAAEKWGEQNPNLPLTISDVPAGGGLPCQYQFFANFTVRSASTGQTAGDQTSVITSSIPTAAELAALLQQQIAQRWKSAPSFPKDRYVMQNPALDEFTVFAVQRTVC